MKYILINPSQEIVNAWQLYFKNEPNVEIRQGDLTKVECDAIVSPANSFGFMDGGVDYAISDRFGWDIEVRLQQQIQALPEGELLIGKALVIEIMNGNVPYLIAAPSMRVPMSFNIATSVNAYLAMKATLIEAKKHPNIETVAMTSFCTGVGRMKPKTAAKQMYQAFLEIEKGEKIKFETFGEAQKYHFGLNTDGMIHR